MVQQRAALSLPTCTARRDGGSIIITATGEIDAADWAQVFQHYALETEDFDFDFAIDGDVSTYTISEVTG